MQVLEKVSLKNLFYTQIFIFLSVKILLLQSFLNKSNLFLTFKKGDFMKARNIIILIIIILVLMLIIQNLDPVNISVLFWTFKISLLLVILISLVCGIILGWLAHAIFKKRKNKTQKLDIK
jgi:uncharacterized integral membrane protein